MSNFVRGQTVYNALGEKAEFIAHHGDGVIVNVAHALTESEEDFEVNFDEAVAYWPRCFAEPPRAVLDEQMTRLSAEIAEKTAKLKAIEARVDEIDREMHDRRERLKQHDALAVVDDFLDGKITHFVWACNDNKFGIWGLEQAKDRYGKFRMLTLGPASSWRGVQWYMNAYSDGSGSDTKVWLARGEDEARAKIRDLLKARIAETQEMSAAKRYHVHELMKSCDEHGVTVPEQIRADWEACVRASLQRGIDQAQAEFERRQQELIDYVAGN